MARTEVHTKYDSAIHPALANGFMQS